MARILMVGATLAIARDPTWPPDLAGTRKECPYVPTVQMILRVLRVSVVNIVLCPGEAITQDGPYAVAAAAAEQRMCRIARILLHAASPVVPATKPDSSGAVE